MSTARCAAMTALAAASRSRCRNRDDVMRHTVASMDQHARQSRSPDRRMPRDCSGSSSTGSARRCILDFRARALRLHSGHQGAAGRSNSLRAFWYCIKGSLGSWWSSALRAGARPTAGHGVQWRRIKRSLPSAITQRRADVQALRPRHRNGQRRRRGQERRPSPWPIRTMPRASPRQWSASFLVRRNRTGE